MGRKRKQLPHGTNENPEQSRYTLSNSGKYDRFCTFCGEGFHRSKQSLIGKQSNTRTTHPTDEGSSCQYITELGVDEGHGDQIEYNIGENSTVAEKVSIILTMKLFKQQ